MALFLNTTAGRMDMNTTDIIYLPSETLQTQETGLVHSPPVIIFKTLYFMLHTA